MRLEDEIHQKEFRSAKIKAVVNILFTASWLNVKQHQMLKDYDLSWQQFNILRILRGAKPEALQLKDITKRMIDKNSNTSRLITKLNKKGFIQTEKDTIDKRKLNITISEHGLEVIEKASIEIEEGLSDMLENISNEDAEILNDLLDKMRSN